MGYAPLFFSFLPPHNLLLPFLLLSLCISFLSPIPTYFPTFIPIIHTSPHPNSPTKTPTLTLGSQCLLFNVTLFSDPLGNGVPLLIPDLVHGIYFNDRYPEDGSDFCYGDGSTSGTTGTVKRGTLVEDAVKQERKMVRGLVDSRGMAVARQPVIINKDD